MASDGFREKLDRFIKTSQCTDDNSIVKAEYIKLVKEFHPDANNEIKSEKANEYMIIINYVYENLIHNRNNFKLVKDDEYEKFKINGKYCFINEFGIKENISDKVLFIYKMGMLEYSRAFLIMHEKPSYAGDKEKTGYEIIGHLYKAYKHYKEVIKLDKNGNWGKNALIQLHYAFKMNEHVTRGLHTSNERGIVPV